MLPHYFIVAQPQRALPPGNLTCIQLASAAEPISGLQSPNLKSSGEPHQHLRGNFKPTSGLGLGKQFTFKMSTAEPIAASHPYYPLGIRLSGEKFVANDWDVVTLILAFAGGWALIASATLGVVRKINPRLKGSDQALVLWFVLCKYTL